MKLTFNMRLIFLTLLCSTILGTAQEKLPNIILIMADDMGYETLGSSGSTSYSTPHLDSMAAHGIRFDNCVSQPLCTPSRVKIMTGLYNYRNYEYFGQLRTEEKTFGNLLKENGYATCIAGKWQLNGLAYTDEIKDWNNSSRPVDFGFEEYCLWQLTQHSRKGGRYADPLIEQNGKLLDRNKDDYGPDIFCQYILDFIDRKKDEPFFIYYPMVLVHDPFVPTPDSPEWQDETLRNKKDTSFFSDMVSYTDKIVGKINAKLEALDLADNTIVIFTGDNGTHPSIYSKTKSGTIRGAKGNTITAGTHVPLIVKWGDQIEKPFVYDGLIEFSDFYATFEDLVANEVSADGKSFLPLLLGERNFTDRETAFVHYNPKWGKNVNRFKNQFVRTIDYKLYQDGKFYNLKEDVLEQSPIQDGAMTAEEAKIRTALEKEMSKHPKWEVE
ncbi:sulfatase-like hydrolase/transferase [Portibacter lacus]|uniref:Arylsulfatase n=1 Tax=Portibacter lacus TaxID=1099794 RepID=A0AA37SSX1_9BACT|nr:sulfatase-like hydrolase/transferase [Portibacter lacus]GLR19733.1 arylsulfatase [Portibacter lacus]